MSFLRSNERCAIAVLLFAPLGSHLACAQQSSKSSSLGVTVLNTSRYDGDGRWDWTVFVRAGNPTLDAIQCVEYTLHPTFPNPVRRVCVRGKDSQQAFALSGNGWGEFTIKVKVFFRDGKQKLLNYPLKLTQ